MTPRLAIRELSGYRWVVADAAEGPPADGGLAGALNRLAWLLPGAPVWWCVLLLGGGFGLCGVAGGFGGLVTGGSGGGFWFKVATPVPGYRW